MKKVSVSELAIIVATVPTVEVTNKSSFGKIYLVTLVPLNKLDIYSCTLSQFSLSTIDVSHDVSSRRCFCKEQLLLTVKAALSPDDH